VLHQTRHMRNHSRRRPLGIAAACAVGLLAAGCQSQAGAAGGGGNGGNGGSGGGGTPAASAVKISITPASGAHAARPGKGISVTVTGGTLRKVSVTGGDVPGWLNSAHTAWHSSWTLPVSSHLTVTATAADSSGHVTTKTSAFRTLTPAQTFTTMIFEGYHQTYGVGMPIMLLFSQPVTHRAAVERALSITTSKPVVGAWHWDNSRTLFFRPRQYWPAHTKVTFTGHLNGVEAAPGVYGAHTLTQSWSIGRSLIVVASTRTHHMRLYRNGKLLRYWPISTGKPGDETPNGTYLTIEKGNPVLMKGPGYAIEVPWSVRFSWSGDYLHAAPWSVASQGSANVSHGCVNMHPADAEFYYKMAMPGDPVTIVGSPKPGVWDNGWTEWFLSWPQFLHGSALHKAVEAGPSGSKFVDPASLPVSTATAPLGTSKPGNARAG
jgi:lipoprotein-anchoring transpeptidase ErfK/SrfK